MSTKKTFRMADSVLHRFVQIVQEAFLTGTDVSDHLRMVELCQDETDANVLVLTAEYVDMVRKQHEQMIKFAEEQKTKNDTATPETQVNESISLILSPYDKK